jgi:integrase
VPTRQSPIVAGVIEGFSPTSVGPVAAAFARAVVAHAGPASVARAKALLFAAAKLGDFADSVGLEPTTELLRDDAMIERFILCGTEGHSAATRRTLRTSLRALARAVVPTVGPAATPLPRERAKAPYSQGEIDAYLALAAAQPTLARRRRAGGLIALGAGAGLVGADLRSVRGIDVFARSGGLVVVVGGKKSRVVPVLARYHAVLGDAAAFAGTHYVVGGNDPRRQNVTTPLISSLTGGIDLARLDAGRLRASWLMTCAEAIGLSSFMAAAGLTCSQRLGDLAAGAFARSEAEVVALLGGCTE